ncbi:Protein APCDD1, partial [Stegodyphus mimosarum]
MTSSGGKTIASFSVFASLLCAAVAASEGGHSSYCQIRQADILRLEADVKVSRNYKGLWVSQKCEIQPGPRFQVRRYHIFRNGHFHLIRYYYLDPWCTKPDYSISAIGYFVPPPEKATSSADSWVVPGGMELDYILRKVIAVPFTVQAAERLSRKVKSSCPGAVPSSWKPFKKYKVLAYEERA